MSESPEARYCKHCEKQLYGRSDQVYCNDTCRNTFNKLKEKQAKTPPYPKEKEIFAIIRRNYDILKRLTPEGIYPGHQISRPISNLPMQFSRKYFTGIIESTDGIWFLCFDRGWREKAGFLHLKDFPDETSF